MAAETELDEWCRLLDRAESELLEREASAPGHDWTQRELAAFGDERDRLAERRDELADARDDRSATRDTEATKRDQRSTEQDRFPRLGIAGDDPGFADRFLSAGDRDEAVGDRTHARDDRRHAQADRQRAAQARQSAALARVDLAEQAKLEQRLEALQLILTSRVTIGQATGLLMERHELGADRAFRMLVHLAHDSKVKLHVIAGRVLALSDDRRLAQERRPIQPPP